MGKVHSDHPLVGSRAAAVVEKQTSDPKIAGGGGKFIWKTTTKTNDEKLTFSMAEKIVVGAF